MPIVWVLRLLRYAKLKLLNFFSGRNPAFSVSNFFQNLKKVKNHCKIFIFLLIGLLSACKSPDPDPIGIKVEALLNQMTLEEKLGQLVKKNGDHQNLPDHIRQGLVGSILNEVNPERIYELQRIAVEESRLGIPLLVGRDVIHGFRTIFPIPLGQAASWNPELVEKGARIAAVEAASQGINWTFAPMIDVTRDPRWGRIAESFGEDPYLTGVMGAAKVRGFQGDSLSAHDAIASCLKHFAAYGWAEGGRDYNTVSIPYNELYDIILPPFQMALEAGAATIMTAFNEINGIPATGHVSLLRDLLREQWGFQGVLLSDWNSVTEMIVHGFTPNYKESAYLAKQATVDVEMVSRAYETYLPQLIEEGRINIEQINDAVRRVLRLKFELGLFENPYRFKGDFPELLAPEHLEASKQMALESVVLLKNEGALPLSNNIRRLAVIGPLADAPHEQMGTWVFDGRKENSITPLQSLRNLGASKGFEIYYHRALKTSRSHEITDLAGIMRSVGRADAVLLFLGEESILSGEGKSLANINLQGAQEELVRLVGAANRPVVAVIMAGRPITFERVKPYMDAVLYAWHPGTMAGPALTDLIFGKVSPSGKLPVTFPRHVGQIPIYYNHKNTGRPASIETFVHLYDIPVEAPQFSLGTTSHYLDYGFKPMFPFGFGLSYSSFEISNVVLENNQLKVGEYLNVALTLKNTGKMKAAEVVQLYTRQKFGSRTRPVRELRAFQKILLEPGQEQKVHFEVNTHDLGFHNPQMQFVTEPGPFQLWVGTCSQSGIMKPFEIVE